jgi:hypothetical protein
VIRQVHYLKNVVEQGSHAGHASDAGVLGI